MMSFYFFFRITTVLISRFFLDLREANRPSNSFDNINGISSTINFAVSRIVGNLGEPLDHSTSAWISGAQDDVVEDVGDRNNERFY